MHGGNLTAFGTGPIQLAPYLLLGAVLGWAAWRSGSLWLPYGLHWANNTYSQLLIGNLGDVLPSGAPLSRDLSGLSPTLLLSLATVQAGLQVLVIGRVLGTRRVSGESLR
jgi:membrane protease YdiL (CAAX protease family)